MIANHLERWRRYVDALRAVCAMALSELAHARG